MGKIDSGHEFTVDSEPSQEVVSPINFTATLAVGPQRIAQDIHLAVSKTGKYVLKWGVDAVCGDGIKEGLEECDDANTVNGDGCSSKCRIECVPGPEVCDNIDNNCNGQTDENLTQSCGSDVGECQEGTQTCSAGSWGPCDGEVVPQAEDCDELDNDCDGQTDEGDSGGDLTKICGKTDVGECVYGTQTCTTGSWGVCEGAVGQALETCDGLDNDCNGLIDEVCYSPYDVNRDGSVTPADALCIFNEYLGQPSCLDE